MTWFRRVAKTGVWQRVALVCFWAGLYLYFFDRLTEYLFPFL